MMATESFDVNGYNKKELKRLFCIFPSLCCLGKSVAMPEGLTMPLLKIALTRAKIA